MRKIQMILIIIVGMFLQGCVEVDPPVQLLISNQVSVLVDEQVSFQANLEVDWESNDESIATINAQGVLTGISEGTVTITATYIYNSEIQATKEVVVRERDVVHPDPIEEELEEEPDVEDELEEEPDDEEELDEEPDEEEPIIIEPEEIKVLLGIDQIDDYLELFEGKRVGLITNQTGFNSELASTIDILFEKVNLTALFAPEHGIRGNLQAGSYVPSYTDEKTGLIVYSLYGATKTPTAEMMNSIDILCIDLQDAGARFYTYIYTMAYAMKAASQYGKEFVVFDRPNPAGGTAFEGNILDMDYASFVGDYPIIQRHGMTIGELAWLFNEEYGIECDLTIVTMQGWKRSMYYDDTNLPWVIPSPNFPSVETALVYPGTCIFEGTNMSEGRGTTIPFQVVGAPFINAEEYANALNALNLPGVHFRPAYFTPTFSKHTNVLCNGVQVHVIDRETFMAVKTGWAMLEVARTLYPNDLVILNGHRDRCMLDLLTGTRYITDRLYSLEEQFEILEQDTAIFGLIRIRYLLYEVSSEDS